MMHIVNVFGMVPKNNYKPSKETIASSDCWAVQRANELKASGINATLKRFKKDEALCVVYKIS